MGFFETIAQLIYAILQFIVIEVIFSAIFRVEDGNIKITFGSSKYKKTSLYVCIVLFIVVAYFYVSNYMQDNITSFFATTGWKTIPTLAAVSSFAIFWLTKVILGRTWGFRLVKMPLFIFILSILFIIFYNLI